VVALKLPPLDNHNRGSVVVVAVVMVSLPAVVTPVQT
jgi:hypothetical protein